MSVSSCKKELEEIPKSYYSLNLFFQDVNQANMAVMGIYETLGQLDTYGRSISLSFTLDSDIAQIDGTTNVSGNRQEIGHYSYTPVHPWIEGAWRFLYIGVDRANLVIERIPQMEIYNNGTEEQKSQLNKLLGEALFLRSLIYFDLVRLWGDVPFKLTPTSAGNDLKLPKTDREVIYDEIIKSMEDAIDLVPWASQKSLDERVSKGAVKGVLARVLLYRGGFSLRADGLMKRPDNYLQYYQKAAQQTKEVIESNEHKLNDDYEQLFKNYSEFKLDPRESMFEISFFNATGGNENSGLVGTWNSPLTSINSAYGRANSFFKTHPVFYHSFDKNDKRRDIAIANFEIDGNGQILPLTGKRDNLWAPGKWRKNWQNTSSKNPNNTDINWVLLRYADVLLMHAEAENEINNGPSASAYDAIDMVRRRAGLDGLPKDLTKNEFFKKVIDERAFELCFEGWRKYDLIRWNMLGEKLRDTMQLLKKYRSDFPFVSGETFVDNKHELLPIPQREIDQNSSLIQNPGY